MTPPPLPPRRVDPHIRRSVHSTQHETEELSAITADDLHGDGTPLGVPVYPMPPPPLPEAQDPSRRIRRRRDSSVMIPITAFDSEFDVDTKGPRTHWGVWLFLGLAAALLGQGAAWWMLRGHGAFYSALLFTICCLAGYIHPVFQRNAKEIWQGHRSPWSANRLLVIDLSALFLGITAGYGLATILIGPAQYQQIFPAAGHIVDLSRLNWGSLDFGASSAILNNNIRVLLAFLLVGLVFRYIGVLFIVVLNGAHWGTALAAVLSHNSVSWWHHGLLICSVLPHLLLEVVAYVLAGMAGIFMIRGLTRYTLLSRHFSAVGTAALELTAVGGALLVVAAGLEGGAAWVVANVLPSRSIIVP